MDDKKQRILVVADKEFARFGIQKTTMDDIAKKARMGKSTLYYYFKSKEEIFTEVIRSDSQKFKLKLNEAIARGNTPQEKIQNYVQTRMRHLGELSNYYTTLTDEYLEHYAFVEDARKDFTDYEINTLKGLLLEGVRLGTFDIENAGIVARNFAIALKGLEYPLLIQNGPADIDKESNQMLNILFKGIEVR